MRSGNVGAVVICLLACVFPEAARGQSVSPSPAPGPPQASGPFACPVEIIGAIPLGAPSDAPNTGTPPAAKTYAFGIQAFQVEAAAVSGTLAIFSDQARYDVPFKDATAAGSTAGSLPHIVPVVVRFAESTRVRAAYVESLDGPNPGPCEPAGAWVWAPPNPPPIGAPLTAVDINGYIMRGAAPVIPVDAPKPVPLNPQTCKTPFAPATLVRGFPADTPLVARGEGHQGEVWVEVVLTPAGTVATQWVWESSGYGELDQESQRAAKASTYAATQLECKPISGAYMFRVRFTQN